MDLIRDTAFGACLRLASGGRVLGWPDLKDEELRQRYLHSGPSTAPPSDDFNPRLSDSESTLTGHPHGEEKEKEKGPKALLIDWLPNDPAVRISKAETLPAISS